MSPIVAEFIGTSMLLLLGNGVVANVLLKDTKGNNSGLIVITMGWGMAVFVAVLITKDFSGAHLNPAVTLGLAVAEKFAWTKVGGYLIAQFAGGAFGAFLVWVFYYQHYQITEDKNLIQATFCNKPAIHNISMNLFSETIGTFVLVFTVLYMSGANITPANPEAPIGLGSIGALPVGLLVLAIGLSLGGTTGYAINPARDLSPRIMHAVLPIKHKGDNGWTYSWIPVAGPFLGGIIAALLFLALGV